MRLNDLSGEINKITEAIVDSAYKVHSTLGPGLLENVYETCMVHELSKRGLKFERQKPVPVVYDNTRLDVGFRLDLLVENQVVVELKSVEKLLPLHEAQVLTYLKLSQCAVGLLLNFNVSLMKDGIRRMVLSKIPGN
jgi:GxxExxY protein